MTSTGKTRFGRSIAAAALTAVVLLQASPATAVSGPTFGDHVQCARTMGFSGSHNPGMHQGAHNWDGMTCNP